MSNKTLRFEVKIEKMKEWHSECRDILVSISFIHGNYMKYKRIEGVIEKNELEYNTITSPYI